MQQTGSLVFQYLIKVPKIYRQVITLVQIVSRRRAVTEAVPRLAVRQPVIPAADAAAEVAEAIPANSAVRPPVPRAAQVVIEFKRIDKFLQYTVPSSRERDGDVDSSSLSVLNSVRGILQLFTFTGNLLTQCFHTDKRSMPEVIPHLTRISVDA
jgi:hypothetical protein